MIMMAEIMSIYTEGFCW